MTIEVLIPRPLTEKLIGKGLTVEQMQLVLHSYLVTGVLPEGVITRLAESNKVEQIQGATVVRSEPVYLRLVEAGGL